MSAVVAKTPSLGANGASDPTGVVLLGGIVVLFYLLLLFLFVVLLSLLGRPPFSSKRAITSNLELTRFLPGPLSPYRLRHA